MFSYSLFFGINKIIAGKIPVNDFYRPQDNIIFSVSWAYLNQSLNICEWLLAFSIII